MITIEHTYDTPNISGYRDLGSIRVIRIHHWGADNLINHMDGVAMHLCNPNAVDANGNDARVSSHFVVEAGRVLQLAPLTAITWHSYGHNEDSIGIECTPRCSEEDFIQVARVIANCWKTLGHTTRIDGHKDVFNTACPGLWYPRLAELRDLALKFYNGEKVATPPPVKKKGKKMLFVFLKSYATGAHKPGSGNLYALVSTGFFCRFTGEEQANRFAKAYGAPVEVTSSMWDALAATAKTGSNSPGYRDNVDADINRIANAVEGM